MFLVNGQFNPPGWDVGGGGGAFGLYRPGSNLVHIFSFLEIGPGFGTGPMRGTKTMSAAITAQVGGVYLESPLDVTGPGEQVSGFMARGWGVAGSVFRDTPQDGARFEGMTVGAAFGYGGSIAAEATVTKYMHSIDLRNLNPFSTAPATCTIEPAPK